MLSELDLYAEELRRRREREHCGTPAWAKAEHLERLVPMKSLRRPIRWAGRKEEKRK